VTAVESDGMNKRR